jgi:serine phosphatase RsbU (regulator of sigma subunit)
LYKTDSILGDYKSAFYHYQLYLDANSKLKSEDFKKVSQNEKFKSDLEKQKLEQKAIQEKRDAKAREDQARQQWIIYSIIAILVLIVAFSFVLFRRYKQINKQNHIIEWQKKLVEEKHKEITDSINYSERIQRSFLASTNLLDKNLKNYFILFKPKDVVSGDFYWADTLPNGDFILVTADSTGHGVPGAIMSILNISSLENAVEKGLLNPAEILMHSRTRIIERLKKDGSVDGGKDGMDCSAIVFNPERTKLKFSAAHNPVWIIRDNQLIELTPDKMPVAKHDKDHLPFTEKEIDLYKNDLIITLTDGYPDQFGGEKGKKFKYKNLSDLLIQLSSLDENAMKSALEHTFDSWKGDLEQVDDVCLIGIRI